MKRTDLERIQKRAPTSDVKLTALQSPTAAVTKLYYETLTSHTEAYNRRKFINRLLDFWKVLDRSYENDVGAEPIDERIRYLYSIVNGDCAAPSGRPGAGILLCNDSSREVHIPCFLIAE
ncbi:hypothetical protein DL766_003575 [Monosporascus sp. MC13-8B]|nr:hypothetical protein DL763_006810 [Monosporascus cannonballus]RYP33270.1 hypothetical protein DL766_003575 [Monosporascus sp. MC13-8B]